MKEKKYGYFTPAQATERIRSMVCSELSICWTQHAKEKLEERSLIMGDVLHVLKNGNVYENGEASTGLGYYRYKMECTTPNSGGRTVIVVVIPSLSCELKIVTVMWKDK